MRALEDFSHASCLHLTDLLLVKILTSLHVVGCLRAGVGRKERRLNVRVKLSVEGHLLPGGIMDSCNHLADPARFEFFFPVSVVLPCLYQNVKFNGVGR